jgi:hypothetical protein
MLILLVLDAALLPAETASSIARKYRQGFVQQGLERQFEIRKRSSEND